MVGGRRRRDNPAVEGSHGGSSSEDEDVRRAMELSMQVQQETKQEEELDEELAAALKASLEEPVIRLQTKMVERQRHNSEEELQEALRVSLLEAEVRKGPADHGGSQGDVEAKKGVAKGSTGAAGGSQEGVEGSCGEPEGRLWAADQPDTSKGEAAKAQRTEVVRETEAGNKSNDDVTSELERQNSEEDLKEAIRRSMLEAHPSSGIAVDTLGGNKKKIKQAENISKVERKRKNRNRAKQDVSTSDVNLAGSSDDEDLNRALEMSKKLRRELDEKDSLVSSKASQKEVNKNIDEQQPSTSKNKKNGGSNKRPKPLAKPLAKVGSDSAVNSQGADGSSDTEPSSSGALNTNRKQTKEHHRSSEAATHDFDDDDFDTMCSDSKSSLKHRLSQSMLMDSSSGSEACDSSSLHKNYNVKTKADGNSCEPMDSEATVHRPPPLGENGLGSSSPEAAMVDGDEVSTTVTDRPRPPLQPEAGADPLVTLDREEMTRRMQGVFQSGLEIHFSGEEMAGCRAVTTPLFPHQRVALAWMVQHESKESGGVLGGILADDMGLGKTLTVISLVLTHHWDGRPLAKPELGYSRPPLSTTSLAGRRRRGRRGKVGQGWKPKGAPPLVGDKAASTKPSITSVFDKFKNGTDKNMVIGKVFNFDPGSSESEEESEGSENSLADFIDDDESDEFDDMTKTKISSMQDKKKVLFDKLASSDSCSEDEDFKKMTREEQMLSMIPRSLDGACDIDSGSDQEQQEKFCLQINLDGLLDDSDSDTEPKQSRSSKVVDSSETEKEENVEPESTKSTKKINFDMPSKKSKSAQNTSEEESDVSLPEVEKTPRSSDIDEKEEEPNSELAAVRSNSETGLKLLIPPLAPAVRAGRRRPTLVVCPTSLISHWVDQLDLHLHKAVPLKLKLHHGSSKAFYATDLESQDIVITTYGTLAAEFVHGERSGGPLLRAKWLRVVLDEGHMVKNHLSKAHKAAMELDTLRKWVVTGTPIQNNLMELWSLTNFLDFDMYAGKQQMRVFKQQIVTPCKNGDPRGFERLQVLMEAICLRRCKADRKPDGSLLVPLPQKTLIVRKVELSEEERLCYGIFHRQAADIVARYDRRGQLMTNYAHIFAMMMRLRQLCCHRELIKEVDWVEVMRDREGLARQLEGFLAAEAGKEEGGGGSREEEQRLVGHLRQMIRDGVTEDCSICLDDLRAPVITPCAHVFCKACIEAVIDSVKPPSCPLCRRSPVSKAELLEAGHQEEAEATDPTLQAMDDILVTESSNKVNAVLREIMRIARDKPNDKIVVVSQFTSFLSVLQPLIHGKSLSCVRLDGSMAHQRRAEAVNVFQSKKKRSPKVLLLSLKAGGVGLNLTAANHLLLLDPAWNPASEWQCFDRIHRMGQTQDVTIYKFITTDSIEETMVEIQTKKKDLISGAFHMDTEERRRQRVVDIRNIFSI